MHYLLLNWCASPKRGSFFILSTYMVWLLEEFITYIGPVQHYRILASCFFRYVSVSLLCVFFVFVFWLVMSQCLLIILNIARSSYPLFWCITGTWERQSLYQWDLVHIYLYILFLGKVSFLVPFNFTSVFIFNLSVTTISSYFCICLWSM